MKLEELLSHHRARKRRSTESHRLRTRAYREHYDVVKAAVLEGVPLRSVVTILRDEEGAFLDRNINAVWQAYRRALRHEGIVLSEEKKNEQK
jgi:hypothetical protein